MDNNTLVANYQFPRGCIVVMAKAPKIGNVKTRMQPQLSEQQSLFLHCQLVEQIISQLESFRLAPVVLQISEAHPFFDQFSLPMRLQVGDNLGARMANAAEQALAECDWVILLGADCPFIDKDYLSSAINFLHEGVQAVVGPASDGGYVLLGLRLLYATLFSAMPWGSNQIMTLTAQRLDELALNWRRLAVRDDIDCFDDLKKLHIHPRLAHWASV